MVVSVLLSQCTIIEVISFGGDHLACLWFLWLLQGGSKVTELSLRPILRDAICFLGSLAMLTAFSANGHIDQYEGIALSRFVLFFLRETNCARCELG